MSDLLVRAALFLPAFFAILAFCACFQRRRAQRRGGWRYLTPGLYYWLGIASGVLITAVATLVVAGGRVDHGSGLLFTSFFAGITILVALQAMIEEVRWNRHVVERRTVFGRRLSLPWTMLARAGCEVTGYIWIASFDGPRLRFSPHDNGIDELLVYVRRHMPRSGPPAEFTVEFEPALAAIAVATRRRPAMPGVRRRCR